MLYNVRKNFILLQYSANLLRQKKNCTKCNHAFRKNIYKNRLTQMHSKFKLCYGNLFSKMAQTF